MQFQIEAKALEEAPSMSSRFGHGAPENDGDGQFMEAWKTVSNMNETATDEDITSSPLHIAESTISPAAEPPRTPFEIAAWHAVLEKGQAERNTANSEEAAASNLLFEGPSEKAHATAPKNVSGEAASLSDLSPPARATLSESSQRSFVDGTKMAASKTNADNQETARATADWSSARSKDTDTAQNAESEGRTPTKNGPTAREVADTALAYNVASHLADTSSHVEMSNPPRASNTLDRARSGPVPNVVHGRTAFDLRSGKSELPTRKDAQGALDPANGAGLAKGHENIETVGAGLSGAGKVDVSTLSNETVLGKERVEKPHPVSDQTVVEARSSNSAAGAEVENTAAAPLDGAKRVEKRSVSLQTPDLSEASIHRDFFTGPKDHVALDVVQSSLAQKAPEAAALPISQAGLASGANGSTRQSQLAPSDTKTGLQASKENLGDLSPDPSESDAPTRHDGNQSRVSAKAAEVPTRPEFAARSTANSMVGAAIGLDIALHDFSEAAPHAITSLETIDFAQARRFDVADQVALLTKSDLSSRIASQIAQASQQLPDRPIEIALSPEELGKVRLTFQLSETGALTVLVAAERPETLELMRRNSDSLLQEFRGMGYEDSSFEFSHQGEGRNENRESYSCERAADAVSERGDGYAEVAQTKKSAPAKYNLGTLTGLDLRI